MQNENALKAAIEKSIDWKEAVSDFIACTTQLGQPFTSGHVTTILRVYRPEFNFKHEWIGEACQEAFYNGDVDYAGAGCIQEPRVCAGLGRTPAGTTVFTYAATQQEALNFPFELDIPKPNSGLTVMPQEHPIQQNVQIKPNLPSPADMKATVHKDHRLCVPRAALEGLLHATGKSFRSDQRVWAKFEGDGGSGDYTTIRISLDQTDGAVDYGVQKTRGRILISKAGNGQFQHGDIFAVEVSGDDLIVDISKAL